VEWTVLLYKSKRNESSVEEFIEKQQPQAQAKILHQINLLQLYGSKLGMPHSKIIISGIYELRIRGKEEIRIFYCFSMKTIYLLHGFKKQTQKTPQKELKIALRRYKTLT